MPTARARPAMDALLRQASDAMERQDAAIAIALLSEARKNAYASLGVRAGAACQMAQALTVSMVHFNLSRAHLAMNQ